MAEGGLLSGILGGEEGETPDIEGAAENLIKPDAFAATIAIEHARSDARVSRAAESFLEEQTGLLRVQTKHLRDEHALRLALLHHQADEGRLRRMGQRIRLAMQLATALILAVVGIGLVMMLVDAVRSQSVIVEAFDAPAALASRGLTGKVVAGALLDELTRLQTATHDNRSQKLSNAWSGDIKVELPETGISIGEMDRLLKQQLGHDLHIEGDLVQTEAGGLSLTVRGDGVLPKTFTAGPGDLATLATQGAEYVFGQSQPSRYANYLEVAGRNLEVIAFCKDAFASDPAADRPFLLISWGDALSETGAPPQDVLVLFQKALKLKPDYWTAYTNIMNTSLVLGDEEGTWRTGEAMRHAAGGRPGRARELLYENSDLVTWNLQAWRSALVADVASHDGVGSTDVSGGLELADVDMRLHDPAEAGFQLQTASATDPTAVALAHFVRGSLATEAGETSRALTEMEAFGGAFDNPAVSSNFSSYYCGIALAEEAAGFPDKADAALERGGHYVDCFRFRGDILDRRGDWAGAQEAYAKSVAIAPDLPAGQLSWGLALARHADWSQAVTKFAMANQHAPHWADPLKAWGDVLAQQGLWKAALAKYDAALRYAPAWAELKQARDTAWHKS